MFCRSPGERQKSEKIHLPAENLCSIIRFKCANENDYHLHLASTIDMQRKAMKTKLALIWLVVLATAVTARADRRKYVWTYQYATIAAGASELEFYQTAKLDRVDSWEYRFEIEHGLTPRWDLSVYQIFIQKEKEAFKWDAFQIRTRYKLAPPGRYFVDPLLYLEYNRKIDLKKQNKLEAKLILSRDLDRFNIAINPVYEFFWAPGDPVYEIGLDAGLSWGASYRMSVGLESTSRIKYVENADNSQSSYLGPTVSFATGKMFYTVGYAWGLTDDSNDARVRFLMGVGLE
jgi:hypothetical protein